LYGDCEHRLNVSGEDYVMRLVAKQNLDFPLLDALRAVQATMKMRIGRLFGEGHSCN